MGVVGAAARHVLAYGPAPAAARPIRNAGRRSRSSSPPATRRPYCRRACPPARAGLPGRGRGLPGRRRQPPTAPASWPAAGSDTAGCRWSPGPGHRRRAGPASCGRCVHGVAWPRARGRVSAAHRRRHRARAGLLCARWCAAATGHRLRPRLADGQAAGGYRLGAAHRPRVRVLLRAALPVPLDQPAGRRGPPPRPAAASWYAARPPSGPGAGRHPAARSSTTWRWPGRSSASGGRIWLGLAERVDSVRPYPRLADAVADGLAQRVRPAAAQPAVLLAGYRARPGAGVPRPAGDRCARCGPRGSWPCWRWARRRGC